MKYMRSFKNVNAIISIGCDIRNSKFGRHVFLGENVCLIDSEIGDFSYINSESQVKNTSIGKFCSIGPNVKIILGKHPSTFVSSHPIFYADNKPFHTFSDKLYFEEFGHVTIGHDVWIAEGVIIPNTVKIGNGAIITSRAVVTKDVEPYSVVGGIPAKHIKFRFDQNIIDIINQSEWWNWDSETLKKNFKLFHNPTNFINHVKKNHV
ncbi:CatB-related O-acetyltransferase [Flavobacterium sp. DGU38]|uniref:CatB-related O-acetyltransferase n=1 Tax=Flavobacterium calami TaxID=3139144 RepID=A0ABU9IP87_9FLAO